MGCETYVAPHITAEEGDGEFFYGCCFVGIVESIIISHRNYEDVSFRTA
jgi:hypothetical protein